ncbi:MAG: type II secretion system F family protein [bacterium]|nr:type II secretion system F family protein [bacterium]
MRFRYKAQKASGELYESERDAADKFALAHELRGEGETPISVTLPKHSSGAHWKRFVPFLGHISLHDKVAFIRNLGGMVGAGLTISRALNVLERQTSHPRFKRIIVGVSDRISTGASLCNALADYPEVFSSIVVSMVRAGEESGNLSGSLHAVSTQLDEMYVLQRKVQGAFIYPAVVMGALFLVGLLMFVYIIPQLATSFKDFNVQLPLSTRMVIAVSDFLQAHLFIGLSLIFCSLFALWVAAKSALGKRFIDFIALRMPVISLLVKETNAARTAQTLSSLLSAGVEIVRALEITAEVLSNSYYKNVLKRAGEAIERGEPMSSVFRENEALYPPFLSEMVAVGEETGKLSGMLKETGEFFAAEVAQKTKDLSAIIEPVLMVVVGVIVGFFALAMITPAYSLMDSI